jgi:hypothetical protein
MVSRNEVIKQLKKINFNHKGWGRSEVDELENVIIPGEEIYECVNGMYEGGFALLVATDIRLLLIDKKPLNFLTIEDMRFDTINEMDYNHRLFGAEIGISAGSKNLRFRSYNQAKLRKLIGHVQHCMAEGKQKQSSHQDTQVSHLEQINLQLQAYLSAQQQYQQQLQSMNDQAKADKADNEAKEVKASVPEPPKPSNELADYLYAQSLLAQHEEKLKKEQSVQTATAPPVETIPEVRAEAAPVQTETETVSEPKSTYQEAKQVSEAQEMYEEGMKEIYNKKTLEDESFGHLEQPQPAQASVPEPGKLEVSPMQIAYSKLPMALRSRKFGKPKFSPVNPVNTVTSQSPGVTNN